MMEEGTSSSGSRRTRSQVAPDWTLEDCLILVNEIAAIESDCSNALSSFQKWTMISDNCNALDVHRTFNQCRRKWDSLVSDYSQINKWEERGSSNSYWSLSVEKRRKLNLPGDVDNELFQAIDAVVMIQENRDGSEPDSDSDPDALEDFDVVDVTPELGSKRSRQRTMVVMKKENPPQKRKTEEETQRKNNQEQSAKATHQKKALEEKKKKKKPVVEISTDEEEEEENTMSIEEEVKALEAKLGEKADLIHAIVGRNIAKGSETGDDDVGIEDKLKFVRQQGDELIACLSEIANTLDRYREVPTSKLSDR
ncbi:trihelix transcription factor ASR3 [Raphanus sativus]|uniref:Trihelix transcription factor ASR3 n=1 Tax=Raphanus sativus TaxID=3726 RepID=A0A6J0KQD9_RAPSA|nr:trihelix transcription factor ASR3 [Raphanus sativus]